METAAQTLEGNCRRFLPIIYRTVRAKGFSHEDAEDVAQEFVAGFVQRAALFHSGVRNVPVRSYLYQQLQEFLHHRRRGQNCLSKGGRLKFLALDDTPPDLQPVINAPADQVYDREWAAMLMQHATDSLKRYYEARGQGMLFDLIRPALTGAEPSLPCTTIARSAGLPAAQINAELQQARQRFGDALRHEVSATVASAPEVDDELRYVLSALAYQG
jgi:DNA-directed RNA polymerase specialized sigma24 family protein